jgi:hypothetical protein
VSTRLSASTTPATLSANGLHVANRFSFGASEQMTTEMREWKTWPRWFTKQLAWTSFRDTPTEPVGGWFPRLADSPGTAWATVKAGERSGWDYGNDFVGYTLARRILSKRQVHEVMVDFWSNLLYVPAHEDRSFPWRYQYDKVVRSHALGSFAALLKATVVHPAMSGWLNNNVNTKNGVNENLGRELLELFTVGRPSGYDEKDVQSSARLLTGFKVKVFDGYAASYEPKDHYVGRVTVLGFTHANASADGRAALTAYLDYLAKHPATAERIARRLCVRFVSDTPSAGLVKTVASAYRSSGTDIKKTLWAMVDHAEFQASKGKKVRTPVEDCVASARVLGMKPTGASAEKAFARQLVWMTDSLGQHAFSWPRPDGFPESSAAWTSPARVLRSWTAHYNLAGNWWGSEQLSRPKPANVLPTAWPRTLGQLVDHQARLLLGRPSTAALRTAVASALNMKESHSFSSVAAVSDWTFVSIRGAVLNAPEGMLR